MLRLRHLAAAILVLSCLPAVARAAFEVHFAPEGAPPLYAPEADGRLNDRPSLVACRLAPGEVIEVDGRLDDAVWARAHAAFGMRQAEPVRFAEVSVPTVFKVAYDDDALYLAAACWEDDMSNVARRLSRRDNIESSDFVSFYIDPYFDRLSGYNFRVTADGVKVDHYVYNDTSRDPDWNAVWEAETWEDAHGWYLEIRIPFRAIRFKPAPDMTWGMQFYRWLHYRGEDTGWVTWDREQSGFVSRWGTLTGITGVENPRTLEALPYVAAGLTDPADPTDDDEEWDRYFNWGADFKYNLTSALTAQATFQPDFGQVEADPAVLNLSPFETFFQEKRPFFVEGSRFFQHPDFNLFYSRRIGTGDVNSRIRAAGKVTGKAGGQTTVAALAAYTDIAPEGQAHNPTTSGTDETAFAVVRLRQDLDGGNHRLGVMGTGVWRQESEPVTGFANRQAFSGGADWEFNFADKAYSIEGSAVGTVLDPYPTAGDDDTPTTSTLTYGTAGQLELRKKSGVWRSRVAGRWESDRFNPNDIGFLSANDDMNVNANLQYRYDADGEDSLMKSSYPYVQFWKSWLYGDSAHTSRFSDDVVWSYQRGHRQSSGIYAEWYNQTHSYWNINPQFEHGFEGTSKYNTRGFEGRRGPLMTTPAYTMLEFYVSTDWRRDVQHSGEVEYRWNDAGSRLWEFDYGLRWNIGRHLITHFNIEYQDRLEDAQWVDNYGDTGVGIDGVAYVFGRLDQQTLDATIRASWLFTRDSSLELYLQPFLTTGTYSDPRYLATPDSRDLRAFEQFPVGDEGEDGYVRDISDYDFELGAVNVNLVWRWEYRPGSTVYLVWTHGRETYDERQFYGNPGDFTGSLNPSLLFDQEPRNTLLFKIDYWFSL
jgi:hypothetical protein